MIVIEDLFSHVEIKFLTLHSYNESSDTFLPITLKEILRTETLEMYDCDKISLKNNNIK